MEAPANKDWWPDALAVLRAGGTVREAAQKVGRSVSVVCRRQDRARRDGVDVGRRVPQRRRRRDGTRGELAYHLRVVEGLSWPEVAERLGIQGPHARRVVAAMASHWAERRGLPSPAAAIEGGLYG